MRKGVRIKRLRAIFETGHEPVWPFFIASLSMSPLPIPLPPTGNAASANCGSERSANRFLKSNRIKRILSRLLARSASADRQ
jgi:hypothetical protein